MTFKDYLTEDTREIQEDKIAVLLCLAENEILTESYMSEAVILEGVKDWLSKVGLKVHKGDGVIDYVRQFSTGAGKLILAAIRGDKEEVKRIAMSLDRAKVVDFILKLDLISLHLITGPIHFIDGLTGLDLTANLKHAAEGAKSMLQQTWDALVQVKNNISRVVKGDNRKVIFNHINNIEKNLPKP